MPKNKYMLFAMIWFLLSVYGLLLRTPSGLVQLPFPHFDKFTHMALFFGQFWLLSKVYLLENRCPPFKIFILMFISWAVISEVLQGTLTQTRSADVFDAVADMVGATLALLVARYVYSLKIQLVQLRENIAD